jgi:hypothetical protein
MPQLIRTPEQIFREEGKDIYQIRFTSAGDEEDFFESASKDSPGREEILDWLKANIPGTHVEPLAPSEESGYICGYFGDLRVDFSESELAVFCARWEDADGGSLDPRFQCFLWPYSYWLEKVKKYVPTQRRPVKPGLAKWLSTPTGFVYHQISLKNAAKKHLKVPPGNAQDLLFHAKRLWPELAPLNPSELTYGDICQDPDGKWQVFYSDDIRNRFSAERKKALLEWFKLPADTEVSNID